MVATIACLPDAITNHMIVIAHNSLIRLEILHGENDVTSHTHTDRLGNEFNGGFIGK